MVFCDFCREWSEQDYTCPNCLSKLKVGFKIVWQGKIGKCDRCFKLLPYKQFAWRVNNSYYHIDCYERKDIGKNLAYTQNLKQNYYSDTTETTQNPSSINLFGMKFSKSQKQLNLNEDSATLDGIDWPPSDLVDRTFENLQGNASHDKISGFHIVKNSMDLPLAYPGQFARVYKVQNNKEFFALRFFTKKREGAMLRYKILHDYFEENFQENNKPGFLINFEYLTNAININIKKKQTRFPLIKMDWVDGDTLENFMKTCKDKNEIKIIKDKFKKVNDEMELYGIAHGDLHPKNIIINKTNEIKLVDYDCMYIRDFMGESMPEFGDPDCQHPNRAAFKYDDNIDRFSALVIYLALMVLEEDPTFFNIIDRDFIFSREDYENPYGSDTFKKLKMFSSDVKYILEILISYCVEEIPKPETLSSILKKGQRL